MKHIFALFSPNVFCHSTPISVELVIKDKDFYHRIETILRLNINDQIILFDEEFHGTCTIKSIQKNIITFSLTAFEKNKAITPEITLYQGLTKKTTFEEIVYICAALGITKIVPIISQKIHSNWWNQEKSIERLTSIAISGCEQAKNFVPPIIVNPIKFSDKMAFNTDAKKILFEPTGQKIQTIIEHNIDCKSWEVIIGPEGGLTDGELSQLNHYSFIPCTLTPTILRSIDAATIGLGAMRVFF